jgi:hypothetical protein
MGSQLHITMFFLLSNSFLSEICSSTAIDTKKLVDLLSKKRSNSLCWLCAAVLPHLYLTDVEFMLLVSSDGF